MNFPAKLQNHFEIIWKNRQFKSVKTLVHQNELLDLEDTKPKKNKIETNITHKILKKKLKWRLTEHAMKRRHQISRA